MGKLPIKERINMLTRQHFEAVAQVLKAFPEGAPTASQAKLAEAFADMFEAENPRFERGRFLKACGVWV